MGHESTERVSATSEKIMAQLDRIEHQIEAFTNPGEVEGDAAIGADSGDGKYREITRTVGDLLLACARGIAPEANLRARVHLAKVADSLAQVPSKYTLSVEQELQKIRDGEKALNYSLYVQRLLDHVEDAIERRIERDKFGTSSNPVRAFTKEEIVLARETAIPSLAAADTQSLQATPNVSPLGDSETPSLTPGVTPIPAGSSSVSDSPHPPPAAPAPPRAEPTPFEGFVRYANWRAPDGWKGHLFNIPAGSMDGLIGKDFSSPETPETFTDQITAINGKIPEQTKVKITALANVFLRSEAPRKRGDELILAPATAYVVKGATVLIRNVSYVHGDKGLYQIWFEVAVPADSIGPLSETSELQHATETQIQSSNQNPTTP